MIIRQLYTSSILLVLLLIFSSSLKADHISGPQLSIGGRLKIDAIYNNDSLGGIRTSKSDLALSASSIPIPDSGKNSLDANLRESRIWATLNIPLAKNKLSTYVEFDFFDTKRDATGRSHVANEPRMRHLYSTFKNLTVGKTYTTFVNLSSYPEINDANGPVGNLAIRQELIRYNTTFSWGETFFALEKGESTFISTTGSSFQVNDDQIPDIIGKIKFLDKWGNLSLAAMLRDISAAGVDVRPHDELVTELFIMLGLTPPERDEEDWNDPALGLPGEIDPLTGKPLPPEEVEEEEDPKPEDKKTKEPKKKEKGK